MLNEYYTQLTIADSALTASTLPGRISAADKLVTGGGKTARAAEKYSAGFNAAGERAKSTPAPVKC